MTIDIYMDILQQLEGREVLIIGDVMLDRYLTGSVTRISPEAPVPVVFQQAMEDRLGGAANVALNICALGSTPVLCSVVGDDADGAIFQDILPANGVSPEGIVRSKERVTTVKTRVIGNHQQMLRIDRENTRGLSEKEAAMFLERVRALLDQRNIQVVIFQDYNKGVLTPEVIETVIAECRKRGISMAVDPKKDNFFAYRGVDLFKPNLKEIRDSSPFTVEPVMDSLQRASHFLREKLENRLTMITLSEKGLFLDGLNTESRIYPTVPRNIADVSGAGDTVISIAALGLAAGCDLSTIAILSNLAGGQVCEYPGVVPVRRDVLAAELKQWLSQNTPP